MGDQRFCPTQVLYNADGTENTTIRGVEIACLDAWQKRIDACSGE